MPSRPYQLIFSVLSIVILLTTSLEIYLPMIHPEQSLVGMFFFNLVGIGLVHSFCNRGRIGDFDFRTATYDSKIIFAAELLIIIQLFSILLLYTFFDTNRIAIWDLTLLFLVVAAQFLLGDLTKL
jgi:hypothetical protein